MKHHTYARTHMNAYLDTHTHTQFFTIAYFCGQMYGFIPFIPTVDTEGSVLQLKQRAPDAVS